MARRLLYTRTRPYPERRGKEDADDQESEDAGHTDRPEGFGQVHMRGRPPSPEPPSCPGLCAASSRARKDYLCLSGRRIFEWGGLTCRRSPKSSERRAGSTRSAAPLRFAPPERDDIGETFTTSRKGYTAPKGPQPVTPWKH
mgnify:CR=1 FL=1